MKVQLMTAALSLLMGMVPAEAQEPRAPRPAPRPMPQPQPPDLGKWWTNSEIVGELALGDSQIRQIEQAFYDHRLKLIDLRAELEKEETRLQPLIEADRPDETKVLAQIDQVLSARGKLEKANTMFMLSIRRILSVEQWKKLSELQRQRGAGITGRQPPAPPAPPAPPRPPAPPSPPPEAHLPPAG